jgi:hypothetical protein
MTNLMQNKTLIFALTFTLKVSFFVSLKERERERKKEFDSFTKVFDNEYSEPGKILKEKLKFGFFYVELRKLFENTINLTTPKTDPPQSTQPPPQPPPPPPPPPQQQQQQQNQN